MNKSRGLGNTTVLIAGCKAQGKVLIVHNADYAEQIAEAHKIKTTCVGDKNYATQPAGSVVDNHAILLLVRENQRIQALADHLLGIMEQKGID